MTPPFTPAQFFDTFRRCNEAAWPARWSLLALAATRHHTSGRARPGRSVSPHRAALRHRRGAAGGPPLGRAVRHRSAR